MSEPILKVENMNKKFGSTVALNDVSLSVYPGEIRGLIGENGSGKSTVTSIVAGMQPCDSGKMFFKGQEWKPQSMIDALHRGIGMIVQESGTIQGVTVAENIFLAETEKYKNKFGLVNRKKMNADATEVMKNIGVNDVTGDMQMQQLDFQTRKLVEIAKVVMKQPQILVIDETSTALSHDGRQVLYDIMNRFRKENKSVIFISHDLDEIMDVCDTLTVLRDGKIIRTFVKEEFEAGAIRASMIGRELQGDYYRSDFKATSQPQVALMEKNTELLSKALRLLPEVKNTVVHPNEGQEYSKPLGKGDSVRIDFGRHLVGHLKLKLGYTDSHPDAPVWLKFSFAENLKEFDEDVENYNGWICSAWVQQEQVHVDVVPGDYELPRRYSFRYVKIDVLDISSKFNLVIEEACATALSSADESRLLPYSNSDKELVKIDRIACNTLHDCMQKVFEDGPKRDRRLWMGDLRLQALANYETYQMNDMVKGCLYLFAALPMENGQVGACVFLEPEPEVDDTVMFDYSLLFITALWDYYKHTNDREALEDLWDTVKTQISLGIKQVGEDNVVKDSDIIGWCFLDWSLELNKQAGAQGVLLYAMQSAIAIAKEVGKNREAECLFETYELYRKAARLKFYDENKGLFTSGADKQVSYASQVWMVLGNVIEPEMGLEVLHNVAAEKDAVEMVTPYIYHYYIEALLKCGAKDEALAVMKNYWGGMAELGADTFWELYNPKNPDESPYGGTIVNSYCHAWSCAPAYFLRRYYSEK